MNDKKVKIIPLGGMGEIGKNITAIEYDDEIIVIDCGIAFPDEEMYGVDLIIPDVEYLEENAEKVKGFFITHGHEDHIGALPYILKQINVPVYGTKLSIGIISTKLEEHKILNDCKLITVEPGEEIKLNGMSMEFIRNTHSIADSCCIAIHTPLGIILHTGDFKLDYTPIDGRRMDLERISELGKKGVLLLMADSTNVERSGYAMSESTVGITLKRIISKAPGRVIVSTFASNIHRMQQIVNSSLECKRKIAFSGRSMENISKVAMELGYLNIPDGNVIDIDETNQYPNERITIITTGSQGEPMAGLARIAFSTHRKIALMPRDLFIISASPIPGNGRMISKVINELFKKGADVIYEALEDVHVSGHACQEELKLIHTLVHPKYFMPVHGEFRHLKHHGDLAVTMGMEQDNIFILETGNVLEIGEEGARKGESVPSGKIFVDGLGVGDVGNIVLRDRKYLAQDGMLIVVLGIQKETFSIITGPDIITRGFVYAKEAEDIINDVKDISRKVIEDCLERNIVEWYVLKTSMKRSVEKYIYEKTKRRPTIIPIIVEV
ncbi:MAG: ribonuclease J [Clostridium sp.]